MAGTAKKATATFDKAVKATQVASRAASRAQTRGISSQQPRKAMAGATLVHPPHSVEFPSFPSLRGEYEYLRDLVKTIPYVRNSPVERPDEEFTFPQATIFQAPSREIGLGMTNAYAHSLKEHGIAAIELGFDDPSSQFILDLVKSMGCEADTHSGDQGALWDVTYKPGGVPNRAKGGDATAHSISHSLGEFSWHTDGAFETKPQRYFGFHVMHPDKKGGGVFRLLKAEDLLKKLSPKTVSKLSEHVFDLRVPDEFYKGVPSNKGKFIETDPMTGHPMVRFRADILFDPPSKDPEANEAVNELRRLLANPEDVGSAMPEYAFKENVVLLMDNARFLHSRTDIKDPKRWLRRVRFNGNPGENDERVDPAEKGCVNVAAGRGTGSHGDAG